MLINFCTEYRLFLVFYFSPEGRKFRTRSEIRAYIENKTDLQYSDSMFDFAKTLKRVRKNPDTPKRAPQPPPVAETPDNPETSTAENSAEEEGRCRVLLVLFMFIFVSFFFYR